jgi:carbon-monoxide dehydrogenase small subunit
MAKQQAIKVTVNGQAYEALVPPRLILADFLRDELDLTGTHLGCEHGVCGACTILLDGRPVRSCLMLAVQANGRTLKTVETLGTEEALHPIQQAFNAHHAMQCGFCTPGFLVSCAAFLEENPDPSDEEILEVLNGHLCRCTGYQNIVIAVKEAAKLMAAQGV